MIQVKKHIALMSPYSPPWSNIDRSKYLRFDLNENSNPPPEHVIKAVKNYIDAKKIQMYPEYDNFLSKLSLYTKTDKNFLLLTNGSDQAIELLLRAFLGPNDKMLIARPEFPIFTQVAGVIGAKIEEVEYDEDLYFPYNEFVSKIDNKVKLIVIINPNNPTGTSISLDKIEKILKDNSSIPVIVDEAYFEYTQVTSLNLLNLYSNLIITRTFSKVFAMAGLRLGYVIARPEIIKELYKIKGPFDVNSVALVAAQAQLDKPDAWKEYVYQTMEVSKPYLENFFYENKIIFYKGAAHFMLVLPPDRDKAVQFLKDNGILVRPMVAPKIKNTFRMCVGTLEQTKHFVDIYKKFITN